MKQMKQTFLIFFIIISLCISPAYSGRRSGDPENSLSHLISKYPLKTAIFDDLENKLYHTSPEGKVTYNPNLRERELGIRNLKALGGRGEECFIKKAALIHLVTAGENLVNGTNGMPNNRSTGAELIEFWFKQSGLYPENDYLNPLRRLREEDGYTFTHCLNETKERQRARQKQNLFFVFPHL